MNMNRIPCGLDDCRVRYEPDVQNEDVLTLTVEEQSLVWVLALWAECEDSIDGWYDMQMILLGAKLAAVYKSPQYNNLEFLGRIAMRRLVMVVSGARES
jgi:hypothetical protein